MSYLSQDGITGSHWAHCIQLDDWPSTYEINVMVDINDLRVHTLHMCAPTSHSLRLLKYL